MAACVALLLLVPADAWHLGGDVMSAGQETLSATAHPPLSSDPSHLWLAPVEPGRRATARTATFTAAAKLVTEARYTEALLVLAKPLQGSPLDAYSLYYRGLAEQRLSRFDAADRTFESLLQRPLVGYLSEAARMRRGEIAEAQGDAARAAQLYGEVAAMPSVAADDVLMRLARNAQAAGRRDEAAEAWQAVYYEYPSSDQATVAQTELDRHGLWPVLQAGSDRYRRELTRAGQLFASRRYAQARSGFEKLQPVAKADDAELVALRLAQCDHHLKRFRAAREALEPLTRRGSHRAEARFFFLSAMRELGHRGEFVRIARELVAAHPGDPWAAEALNSLATHFIITNEDAQAEAALRQILARHPDHRHAQRAAWRAGWWAYKRGEFDDTVTIFEAAAARFPRSDYRPTWLYWSARAHEQRGRQEAALARHALVVTDYRNSYYGRLSTRAVPASQLSARVRPAVAIIQAVPEAWAGGPPTQDLIRALIQHEMYADAMNELRYAQRVWGDSPAVQATIALVHSRTGELRLGINAMRRAYPQYMATGGELLPEDMLKVIFPLAYWDLLQRYSAKHGLDPYLVAALVAQESTFDRVIRSPARAVGLMQIMPATGRRYATRVGIRRYRPAMLTNADTNVRLGTAILADVIRRFGDVHLALASYNAGEGAVARWVRERPGMPREQFIDDIPYPETQIYVKKILGTAEDYRMLYGELGAKPSTAAPTARPATPVVRKPAAKVPAKKAPAKSAPAKKAPARRTAPKTLG